MVTGSIVIYKTPLSLLEKAINSFFCDNVGTKLYIIDNSPVDNISSSLTDKRIEYIHTKSNLGYGAGHNLALSHCMTVSTYHLVFNADVYFEKGVLTELCSYMGKQMDIGLVMPKVLYPDGRVQYLCKLLPTPYDLFFRRFIPIKRLVAAHDYRFELRFSGYNKEMNVPYLSGCFMFLRVEALNKVGLFDERYFMYPEDIDLTRRLHLAYKTMFYPQVAVYHNHEKASFKSIRMMWVHIWNLIKYFNKWGWWFDAERKRMNRATLSALKGIA